VSLPGAVQQRLQASAGLMNAGRMAEATHLLSALIVADPGLAPAHSLLGQARAAAGDLAGAEASLREAVKLGRRDPSSSAALGDVLVRQGRREEAEKAYRAALSIDRRMTAAAMGLANVLAAGGRAAEALQVTTPLAAGAGADAAILQRHGQTLRALGRFEDALPFYQRAVALDPACGIAEHNWAAALGDAEDYPGAEAATRRALSKGVDAPETHLVLARALLAQDRYDEAEATFHAAIQRRPAYDEAQRELAHLTWMRTEDIAKARAGLDAAVRAHPDDQRLPISRAKLLEASGDKAGAFAILAQAAAKPGAGALLLTAAAQLAIAVDPPRAVALATAAQRLAPHALPVQVVLCEGYLATGEVQAAAALAQSMLNQAPDDHHALACLATAWRLLGDDRYGALYDYAAFVRAYTIDTPDGWNTLAAYLDDLRTALEGMHGLRAHPVGQSLRHGSQTSQSLRRSDHPAIRGFFQAIDGPIRRHMAELGRGRDPVRRRNHGGYRISGIWSVRLRPGGFHVDHVHPQGWLSSACYITLPTAVAAGGGGLDQVRPARNSDPTPGAAGALCPAGARHAGVVSLLHVARHRTFRVRGSAPERGLRRRARPPCK
jgi:tetratricopeptide (TPR) repeat protein